jgi:hypothetical protein
MTQKVVINLMEDAKSSCSNFFSYHFPRVFMFLCCLFFFGLGYGLTILLTFYFSLIL